MDPVTILYNNGALADVAEGEWFAAGQLRVPLDKSTTGVLQTFQADPNQYYSVDVGTDGNFAMYCSGNDGSEVTFIG